MYNKSNRSGHVKVKDFVFTAADLASKMNAGSGF